MKKTLLAVSSIISLALVGCGALADPVDYNNDLVDLSNEIVTIYNDYSTYAEETALAYVDNIEEKRVQAVEAVNIQKQLMIKEGDYKGDATLLDAFVADAEATISLLEEEEKELVALWMVINDSTDEEYAQNADAWTAQQDDLYTRINERLDTAFTNIQAVQTAWAAANDFELE